MSRSALPELRHIAAHALEAERTQKQVEHGLPELSRFASDTSHKLVMKRNLDLLQAVPEILKQIQAFTEFAPGVPAKACAELLAFIEEGGMHRNNSGDWAVGIRRNGPKKHPQIFVEIDKRYIVGENVLDRAFSGIHKSFDMNEKGFHEAIAWSKATLCDLKTRGPCPKCLRREGRRPFLRLRLDTAELCAPCCMQKILGD